MNRKLLSDVTGPIGYNALVINFRRRRLFRIAAAVICAVLLGLALAFVFLVMQ